MRKARTAPARGRSQQVRIIGGRWRSRRLCFAPVPGLRPTGDRLRETLFNWLARDLPGSVCLDAFAGTGVLGLEALSRGARCCVLLETHASAYARLRENCKMLDAESAIPVRADTPAWLGDSKNRDSLPAFDVVFLDPPFASTLLEKTCALLESGNWLADGACIYLETSLEREITIPDSWLPVREKRTGEVQAHLYRRRTGGN